MKYCIFLGDPNDFWACKVQQIDKLEQVITGHCVNIWLGKKHCARPYIYYDRPLIEISEKLYRTILRCYSR